MRRWLKLHSQNCVNTLRAMLHQPVATILTALVIGIAIALPATLNLFVMNARSLAGGWESIRDFSVYMTPGTSLDAARSLAKELDTQDGVADVTITSAEDALTEFRESSGLGEVIESLDDNPLPHTLTVRPADTIDVAELESLAAELQARSDVDAVQIDTGWVTRLNAILDFLRRIVVVAGVLLAVGVVVIVGNTIRLEIQNRRDEIEVLKLLGASDGFVRRPFLYTGLWYGILGGSVALLLLIGGGWILAAPIERLVGLYAADIALLGLNRDTVLAVLGGGMVAGWAGAWTAVARHLSDIQPK